MSEYQADNLENFIALMRNFHRGQNRGNMVWIFRGVSDVAFELIPSVGRSLWPGHHLYGGLRAEHEQLVLEMFEARCVAFLEHRPASRLEVMLHAQHHGMPTRLLDWTFSPLVALFFALNGSRRGVDVAVYAGIPPKSLHESPIRYEVEQNPLQSKQDYLVHPPWVNRRISAQQSCFTLHAEVKAPIQLSQMAQIIISADKVPLMQRELHNLGVKAETIFPDLDGLAKSITFDIFGPLDAA